MRIVVMNGVTQAPGRADEDTRDNFKRGGKTATTGVLIATYTTAAEATG